MSNHYAGRTLRERAQAMAAFETWLLSFIKDWTNQFGSPPAIVDMCRVSNLPHSTIYLYLAKLRAKGKLQWEAECARTWKVIEDGA